MSIQKQILIFLGLSVLSFSVFSKVLIVSDVDDTIRNTHVLSLSDALYNATTIDRNFLGMNIVYQELVKEFQKNKEEVELIYLTNGKSFISGLNQGDHLVLGSFLPSVQNFLNVHEYPYGEILMSEQIYDPKHKIVELRKLLKKEIYSRVLFFGDNGEKDIFIYNQIKNEFKNQNIVSFIHVVYSPFNQDEKGNYLLSNQTPYVTAIDLIEGLNGFKIINDKKLEQLYLSILPGILQSSLNIDEGELAIPSWVLCDEFKVKPKTFKNEKIDTLRKKYFNFIKYRCL